MGLEQLLLTVAVSAAVGYLLQRAKIPGGMMFGSVIGALALNLGWGMAFMPKPAKLTAQILAGAFIGCTVEAGDLKHLRQVLKPVAFLLGTHLLLNITTGTLIYLASPLDLVTAFMCAIPGGMSDIPLIAADMGADASKVVVMQFVRMLVGIGVFPSLIRYVTRNEEVAAEEGPERVVSRDKGLPIILLTVAVAAGAGLLGYFLKVQAGALLFSLFGVVTLKLTFGRAFLPLWVKRLAQVLSGAFIGSSISYAQVGEMRFLALPAVILIAGYSVGCFVIGFLLQRFCGMSKREGMLAGIPAGASDMALIASDLGIHSTNLVVLQVIRLIVVVALFPQVTALIQRLFG